MSTQAQALASALELMMDRVGEPPKANCSCHLSPPCSDCVEYSGLREAFDAAREALAMPAQQAPRRVAYAGICIWIGDKQVEQFVSEEMVLHEPEQGIAIFNACQLALDLIAAAHGAG